MLVTMSDKELNRLNVIQAVCEKRLRQRDAASQLNLVEFSIYWRRTDLCKQPTGKRAYSARE